MTFAKISVFFASDARHLQTRLEKLADQGLELVSTEGLLCGRFERMERRELQYAVVSCGRAREFPLEEIRHCGWELVGGFNGMAILKGRPCVDADRETLNAVLERSACLHPDRWTTPLMVLLSVVFAILCSAEQTGLDWALGTPPTAHWVWRYFAGWRQHWPRPIWLRCAVMPLRGCTD